jgi:hypothetical protein
MTRVTEPLQYRKLLDEKKEWEDKVGLEFLYHAPADLGPPHSSMHITLGS